MQSEEEGAQLASGWHWGLAPRSCLRPRVLVRHRRTSRASVFRGKLQGATEKQEHTPICVSLILGLSLLPELSSGGMGGRGTHASSREAQTFCCNDSVSRTRETVGLHRLQRLLSKAPRQKSPSPARSPPWSRGSPKASPTHTDS